MIKELKLEVTGESVTASNYEERVYIIKSTDTKLSVSGRHRVVITEESGMDIWINNKSLVRIVKAHGIKRTGWIGKSIYPAEIIDTIKGKSINWMTTDK